MERRKKLSAADCLVVFDDLDVTDLSSEEDDSDPTWDPSDFPGNAETFYELLDDQETELGCEFDGASESDTVAAVIEDVIYGSASAHISETPAVSSNNGSKRKGVWRAADHPLAGARPTFQADRDELLPDILLLKEPVEFFLRLFPDALIEKIAFESTRYAVSQGSSFSVSVHEMKLFLGINLVITYLKYPRLKWYWKSDEAMRIPIVADSMSRNRFDEISKYLHFNEAQSGENDKFFKVRPVLDVLKSTFLQNGPLEEHHSIDEMMIPFKGRSQMKQYIKSKPKPWGFKCWARASSSGYIHEFEMYEGAAVGKETFGLGVGGDVVARLSQKLTGRGYKIYADNFFTSVSLAEYLAGNQIHLVGTVRQNRIAEAASKLKPERELKIEGRGASSVVTNNNVTILRWFDNKIVHTISTYAGVEPQDEVKRWSKKDRMQVPVRRPYAIQEYNKSMGGVDLMDYFIALYRHNRRGKKYYMKVFWNFVDVAVVNAWILYRKAQKAGMEKHDLDAGLKELGLLEFKASVARTLINTGKTGFAASARPRGRPSQSPSVSQTRKRKYNCIVAPEIRYDGLTGHWPTKTNAANAGRCSLESCTSKSRIKCVKCEKVLCLECFESFHTR
jgi:hypothetical protein